jgi:hypothetical protein
MRLRTPIAGRAFAAHPRPDAICRLGAGIGALAHWQTSAEAQAPVSDGLVTDHDASRRQDGLDVAEAQAEAMVQPNGVLNDLSLESAAAVRAALRNHGQQAATAAETAKLTTPSERLRYRQLRHPEMRYPASVAENFRGCPFRFGIIHMPPSRLPQYSRIIQLIGR